MSKNSEKGRRGELAVMGVFANVGLHEKNVEVLRDGKTTSPDGGVDISMIVPHNLSVKLDEIVSSGSSEIALSNANIDVRLQVKNYTRPISKATMDGFIEECATNEKYGEHWGAGGPNLSKGAQKSLDEGKKLYPVKWYTASDIAQIQANYPAIPFTEINDESD